MRQVQVGTNAFTGAAPRITNARNVIIKYQRGLVPHANGRVVSGSAAPLTEEGREEGG